MFCMNIKKSIWPKYFHVCSKILMWLWQLGVLPHWAQAASCIKINLKALFLPEDMQEHEVKHAVWKTSSNWKNKIFPYPKPQQTITQLYAKSVTKTLRVHFLASPAMTAATVSESLCTTSGLTCQATQYRLRIAVCLVKCKAVIKKTKHMNSLNVSHPITHQVKALWANTFLLCQKEHSVMEGTPSTLWWTDVASSEICSIREVSKRLCLSSLLENLCKEKKVLKLWFSNQRSQQKRTKKLGTVR